MKKLYIIRHAKSSWKDLNLEDYSRPLNKRGKKDAPFMGKILNENGVYPDIIISSPALRAKTTTQSIAKELHFNKPVTYDKQVYEADLSTLLQLLLELNKKDNIVFIIGHNPGLNMLLDYFVGFDDNIPTCGVVELEFDCKKWDSISSKNAKLISFDYPKKHTFQEK